MEENEKRKLVPIKNVYIKSNVLIRAKYKSTINANKLMAVALSRTQDTNRDENGNFICSFAIAELRRIFNMKTGNSFYKTIDNATKDMAGQYIGISDPSRGYFDYVTIISRATLDNGVLTIKFNSDLAEYLQNVKANFTMLNLTTMLSFTSIYSFRLFELLKSHCYGKRHENKSTFLVDFGLSELKLELGCVDSKEKNVMDILRKSDSPDYDEAVSVAVNKCFDNWDNFRRRVLLRAVDEINEKTNMKVEMEPVKNGKGGKVRRVNFYVTYLDDATSINKINADKPISDISTEEKFKRFEEINAILKGLELSFKDLQTISEKANYDVDRVKKAYEVMNEYSGDINNVVGFILKAIKDDYQKPVKVKRKKKNSFMNFDGGDVDADELGNIAKAKLNKKLNKEENKECV